MFEIDKRMLYILPAVLALAISITVFFFEFGNHFVDLKNICYTIFVEVPDDCSEEECTQAIKETLEMEDVQGFTMVKNATGGHKDENNNLVVSDSYQIILMDISKDTANKVARTIQKTLDTEVMIKTAKADVTYIYPANI